MKLICTASSGRSDRVVTFTASLRANQLKGWGICVGLEPSCSATLHRQFLAMGDILAPIISWINHRTLGPALNAFLVYDTAFAQGASAVLYCDDDMILSPDAVRLCDWYLSDPTLSGGEQEAGLCLCTNFHNDPTRPNSITPHATWVGLVGQGYCITAAQWHNFMKRRFWSHEPHYDGDAYDWSVAHSAVDLGKRILRPRFSRSQHTGITGLHPGTIFPEEISQQSETNFVLEDH